MTEPTKKDPCDELPQVALAFMNTVHCEEVLLTQRILQALDSGHKFAQVDVLMSEWVEHTVRHFAREERLMEEYKFPPFPIHLSEHVFALEDLRAAESNWLDTRDAIALNDYISHSWRGWLDEHILTMDTVTARFLSKFDIQVDLDLD